MSNHIKSDEFIQIAIENGCDAHAIISYIRENINPEYAVNTTQINNRISNYRRKGLLPLASGNTVSTGEILKGSSTLYDMDGNIVQQWVKTDVPRETQLNAFKAALDTIAESIKPYKPKPFNPNHIHKDDLLTVYPIGDAHVGQLSWKPESGEDNDLAIAKHRLLNGMSLSVEQALPTKEAYIIDVGDWFHSDNNENRTARGNNALDVDGRYGKVLEVGLSIATALVEEALKKHNIVRWRSAIGNHNEHSAMILNVYVKAYFRNEPRVIVHDSPSMFDYFQFGKCLIGVTHGHTAKADKLGEIMSVDCNDIWSSTKHRYWYTGHIHHQSVKEYPSCIVETFRTLASKDAWHASMGYRSGQDIKTITLHKDYGEVTRNTINISILE